MVEGGETTPGYPDKSQPTGGNEKTQVAGFYETQETPEGKTVNVIADPEAAQELAQIEGTQGRNAALARERQLAAQHELQQQTGLTPEQQKNVEIMEGVAEKYPNAVDPVKTPKGEICYGSWGKEGGFYLVFSKQGAGKVNVAAGRANVEGLGDINLDPVLTYLDAVMKGEKKGRADVPLVVLKGKDEGFRKDGMVMVIPLDLNDEKVLANVSRALKRGEEDAKYYKPEMTQKPPTVEKTAEEILSRL